MDSITTKETSTGISKVGDNIRIHYTFESRSTKPVERVSAVVRKNDVVVGYFNTSPSGESGLTFIANNDLSLQEKQEVAQRIYADEFELFNAQSVE